MQNLSGTAGSAVFSVSEFAASIDSTNLRLDSSEADILGLCEDAARHRFASVIVYPGSVALASAVLRGTDTCVGTVIGFPSGRSSVDAKAAEILAASQAGAREVSVVMNYPALRAGRIGGVSAELTRLTKLAHDQGQRIKVIVETCFLDTVQKRKAFELCETVGADFIETSTGFGSAGAQIEDIAEWERSRRGEIGLKASGDIRTLKKARALIEAGATRIGTANAVAILSEL